jgi:hypothetical protein
MAADVNYTVNELDNLANEDDSADDDDAGSNNSD